MAGAIGGYIYWQYNKKKIVKDSIADAIAKKTDSLYYLKYDSSRIDEINGNAVFYNVVLQSDSAQKQLLNSTDSLPNALYNIRIKQVAISGVDIAGLLQQQNVKAKKITLVKPQVQIINTGADKPKPFTINDTLELYQKILGKFKRIQSDQIEIVSGVVLMTNKAGKAQTTLENINIILNNFLVDSTKNYESIVSYFIKDVRATIENIQLPESATGSRINMEKVDYNAAKRTLAVGAITQYQQNNISPVINLKNIKVTGLVTDAFIIQQRLKAGQVSCEGGLVTIYVKKNPGGSKPGEQTLELTSGEIEQAQIAGIRLGNTKLVIINKDQPKKEPFVLNNVNFTVTKIPDLTGGMSVNNIINNAQWQLSADGFSIVTKDKLYKLTIGNFSVDNTGSVVKVSNLLLKPMLTEQQFVNQSRHQNDQYNLTVKNIVLSGVNLKKLLTSQEFEIEKASFEPDIKIFNDRTLPPDADSKLGKYPHQSLLKLPIPLYIHMVTIRNGQVSYRERALKSKLTGNVIFNELNATVNNVTNMPRHIAQNNLLKMNAGAKFLRAGVLTTEWQFPLDDRNGRFFIKGELKSMSAITLNSIIEPLAMASVKEGQIDGVRFSIDGTDKNAAGNILFLYHDLKMELLKMDNDEELKKKGFLSFLANTLIKNENTSSTNSKEINYERDMTKSFFNLVWKTIFEGAKKTATGRKEKEEKVEEKTQQQ